ncbi:MAG: EAL domain-containing protein [Azoarcus sp.]|nr:EAL domain-containing protein [Azoarcus sp.]
MKVEQVDVVGMAQELQLDDDAIASRKAFLGFDDGDVARLKQLHGRLQGYAPLFAEHFYKQVLAFDETRSLLADPNTVERLQAAQVAYFEGLTAGDYGRDYIHHRLRVGLVHHRVGLEPKWYLGAYANYLVGLLPEVARCFEGDQQQSIRSIQSLVKVVLLDMGLAIDTYIQARDNTIRGLKNYAGMVFDSMHDGILVLSPTLSVLSANQTFIRMFELESCSITGRKVSAVLQCRGLDQCVQEVLEAGNDLYDVPVTVCALESGAVRTVRVTVKRITLDDEAGHVLLVLESISAEEISRKATEAKLSRSAAMLRDAQAVAKIGSWSLERGDADSFPVEWSEETYRLFGIPPGTPISYSRFLDLIHPDDRPDVNEAWQRALSGEPYRVEHRIQVNGKVRWLEERAELEFDDKGEFVSALGTAQDITDRRLSEVRIEQFAFYDSLTGLPNRALFQDRLHQALAHASRHGQAFAVLFIDLDRFKEVNDTQGHACGDLVLSEVARRFQTTLRHDETLARLGGDEFVIIAHETGRSGATLIAERLNRVLVKPVEIGENAFSLGASTGVASYPGDGVDAQQLLKHADIAMYQAKHGGGGRYCFYGSEMGAELARRLEIAHRLNRILHEDRLQLHFQPQLDLKTGELTGAEALLRWRDPEWGWVSPGEFIPIAEERGMMIKLGEWVIKQACEELQTWRKAGLSLPGRLAINVAAQQIDREDFARRAIAIVSEAGISPAQIELEITESGMMLDPECAMKVTRALVDAGFTIAIDDFGTGHSSLAYLKRFPANTLKVDMSFVRTMLKDRNDLSIVATIIAMAKNLGLQTLAEGVEESAQAERLLTLGCDKVQGYLFGRPEAPAVFAKRWLETRGA